MKLWARILRALPTSRLLLKNKPFACSAARQHVTQLFVKEGIAADRIDLMPLAIHNAGKQSLADKIKYAPTCDFTLLHVPVTQVDVKL